MSEAGALDPQLDVEVEGPAEPEAVRVYETPRSHVDRLPDGTFRVVSDTLAKVVGDFPADPSDPKAPYFRAVASANQAAGPPQKVKR